MPDEQDEALGRLAHVLTGDDRRAAALLGEVALLTRRRRRDADRHHADHGDHQDHEDRRALLVQRLLRQRSRTAATPQPEPGPAPEPAPDPDPAPQPDSWTRLARLDPLGRALLVLRHGEHLTLAELARLADRSPAAVTRVLEQAEARAEVAPYEVEQLLWQAVAPDPGAVREAERSAAGRRKRWHARIALVGLAAAGLVAAGTVVPGLLRADPYVRPYGEWTFTAELATPGPYTLQGRELTAGKEMLSVATTAKTDATCSVTVTTTARRVVVPNGRKATLDGRPARFVDATTLAGAGLWWSVGPTTSAVASCDVAGGDQALLDLAGQVRFARSPLRTPFDLRHLPADEEVAAYVVYFGTSAVVVSPRGQDEQSSDAVFVGLVTQFSAGAVSGRRVDVNGSAGRMTDDEDETTLCWPSGVHTVCAEMAVLEGSVSRPTRVSRTTRLIQTARAVRLAPDLDRPDTWFDAQDVLPR